MSEDLKQVENVLNEKVRPILQSHGGEIAVERLEDGVLYVKLLGQCAGCPSADLTNETLVEAELTAALPEVVRKVAVVQAVSDELWEQAKKLLRDHRL
ncbi:MAG: NifU family protein [Oscillibacter sp.]|nr:NifU family protein [Oscillibacter sp.]